MATRLDLLKHLAADILHVDVRNTADVLLQDLDRVLARNRRVAGVEQQSDQSRIGQLHQAVDLIQRRMPVPTWGWKQTFIPVLLGAAAQLVQTLGQILHLLLSQDRAVGWNEGSFLLAVYGRRPHSPTPITRAPKP